MDGKGIAYIAGGRLYLKEDGVEAREIVSPFAREVADRHLRIHEKNSWKTQGRGAQFMSGGMLWGERDFEDQVLRVRFNGVTRGPEPGKMTYALQSEQVGGLFTRGFNEPAEQRHFHKNDFFINDLDRHPDNGKIAYSQVMKNGSAAIVVTGEQGQGAGIVTEGDSFDEAPAWVPGRKNTLLFQSAGVGRNDQGYRIGLGPAAVEELDLSSGHLRTIRSDDGWDFLQPRMTAEGSLYFIKRPYHHAGHRDRSLWGAVKDLVLFPFRLIQAIFSFLNVFSMTFSGKPLTTAGGPKKEGADARQVYLRGRKIEVDKALRKSGTDDSPALVPPSWELVRRDADGSETALGRGVLAFDLLRDGRIVYTNGSAVFMLSDSGGREKICKGTIIDAVAALD